MVNTPREVLTRLLETIKDQNELGLSNTARLRLVKTEITSLLGSGLKQDFLLEKLATVGLVMSLAGFRSSMKRIKAENKELNLIPARVEKEIARSATSDEEIIEKNGNDIYSESDWREVNVRGEMQLNLVRQYGLTPAHLEGKSKVQVSEYLSSLHKGIHKNENSSSK